MELAKIAIAGVIGVAMVSAFGLHAEGLSKLSTSGSKGFSRVLNTAEKG